MLVADVHGQVVEDRAFGDALQALDPDVVHGKRRVGEHLGDCGCTVTEQWEAEAPGQLHGPGRVGVVCGISSAADVSNAKGLDPCAGPSSVKECYVFVREETL